MKGRGRNEAFFLKASAVSSTREEAEPAVFRRSAQTGVLNLSNRGLCEVPAAVYDVTLQAAGEKFWEIVPLQKLDLSYNRIRTIPEGLVLLSELTTFKARDNQIHVLPGEVLQGWRLLRSLDVSQNRVEALEDRIGELSELIELLAFQNKLTKIPESISSLVHLKHLDLSVNHLSTLPNIVLPSLVLLNVTQNNLTALPPLLSEWISLEVLECRSNKISRLPDLSRLAHLTRLDSMENKIKEFPLLPASRGKTPPTLAFINLSCNLLDNFDPSRLVDQTALAEIHVASNVLKTVPGNIWALSSSLKVLDISNNALADIPYTLGYMKDLHRISAAGNPIRTIRQSLLTSSTSSVETEKLKQFLRTRGPNPREVEGGAVVHGSVFTSFSGAGGYLKTASVTRDGSLTYAVELRLREIGGQQKDLDLSKLELTSLDFKSISLIDRLQASPHCVDERGTISLLKLNLSRNNIGPQFPSELVELQHLRSLDLRENKLGASPLEADFSALGGLTSLDISGNKVKDLAVIARNFSRLQVLLATNNDIEALSPSLALLTDLRELRLSHNKRLSRLDTVEFSQLKSLTILDVSNCHISDILAVESASSKLQTLLLDNNDLGAIPSFIGKFPNMICVSFCGNPQRNVRQAIIDRGTGAILELLRSRTVS